MRILLYLLTGFFFLAAIAVGGRREFPMSLRLAVAAVELGIAVYFFSLALRYSADPRGTKLAFFRFIGWVLVIPGGLFGLNTVLPGPETTDQRLAWLYIGLLFAFPGVLAFIFARRYRHSPKDRMTRQQAPKELES